MMNHTTEALQLLNATKFFSKYCRDLTNSEQKELFDQIAACADFLDKWDLDLRIDREYSILTIQFLCHGYWLYPISTEVDFDEISKDFDLDNLSYSVCNQGLN